MAGTLERHAGANRFTAEMLLRVQTGRENPCEGGRVYLRSARF
jgi:hypothetical protein